MALLTCPDCQGKVSDRAPSCPHCGRPADIRASAPDPVSADDTALAPVTTTTVPPLGVRVVLVAGAAVVLGMCALSFSSPRAPARAPSRPAMIAGTAIADSVNRAAAAAVREHRARADSILAHTASPAVARLPDSTLRLIVAGGDSASHAARYVVALTTLRTRAVRQAVDARAGAVLSSAREASTIDGKKCDRASRDRAARLVARYPTWSDGVLAVIMCGWIQRGMTAEQVIASWGRPRDINRTVGSWGVHEQWVYGEFGGPYVYLEDGVVTSWQN
jgi:hypothetical protein